MYRTTLVFAAAALFAVTAAACGSDGGASTYETTRDGREPRETRPRDTRPPRTEPSTPGTIVLPTFPSTSSTDVPPSSIPAAGDIAVQHTWFADDGYGGVSWGATYESSADAAQEYVPVQVEFLDDGGDVIGTAESTISLVLPGASAMADYTYDLDGTPASIEVTIGEGDPSEFQTAGELTVANLARVDATDSVTGQITSTYATDLDDVTTVAVWRDAAGAPTGIASDYVRIAQANGVSWFGLTAPTGTTGLPTDVYVTPRPEPYAVTAPDASLTLTESWFRPDGTGGYDWGAIATNAGTTIWSAPNVQAKFFDGDGRLIDTDDGYFGDVRPGKSAVIGYLWDTPAVPTRMEVVFADGGYVGEPDAGELTISDVAVTPAVDGTATVTGTVTSTYPDLQSYAEIILIWRDAAGAVSFATSTYVEEIASGGTAPIEVDIYGENLPTGAPSETYWSI